MCKEPYIYVSDKLRSSFETVLQYIGLTRLLPTTCINSATGDDEVDSLEGKLDEEIDDERLS